MFPRERFSEAGDYIYDMWMTKIIHTKDVWEKRKPFGIPGLWHTSIGKTEALRKLLHRIVDVEAIRSSGIEFRLTAVSLTSGKLRVFDQNYPDIIESIMASTAFPLAFPPIEIDGELYTDGGVVEIAPLKHAITSVSYTHLTLPTTPYV